MWLMCAVQRGCDSLESKRDDAHTWFMYAVQRGCESLESKRDDRGTHMWLMCASNVRSAAGV